MPSARTSDAVGSIVGLLGQLQLRLNLNSSDRSSSIFCAHSLLRSTFGKPLSCESLDYFTASHALGTYPHWNMDAQHDFVIVGGGLSGLVVASRLTEDPDVSVLVLEAGQDHTADPRIRTPASWISVLGQDDFDWAYTTVPQVS